MWKVLIAEEQDDLAPALVSLCGELGAQVVRATDGRSALRAFETGGFRICFLDALLPGLDGFEVCKAIKKSAEGSAIPVVMTSDIFADREMVEQDMSESGADEFLARPADPRTLARLLVALLPELVGRLGDGASNPLSDPGPDSDDPGSFPGDVGLSTARDMDSRKVRKGAKVLIVEDQEDLNYIYRGFVSALGLEAIGAFDGDEALALFKGNDPDMCLVDLLLPGINGFEVCRRIKSHAGSRRVPVVVMSAVYRNVSHLERDLQRYGADDFIHKPFSMDALHEMLINYLPEQEDHVSTSSAPIPTVALETREAHRLHLDSSLPEEGDLSKVDFCALLFRLRAGRRTGRLTVRRDEVRRAIDFVEGCPVRAESNSNDDTLGTILAKRGLLDLDAVNDVVLDGEFSGNLGSELVRRGLITEEELDVALIEQSRQIILVCFALTRGAFSFKEVAADPKVRQIDFNPLQFIRDGIARTTSANQLAELMQGDVHRYATPTSYYTSSFSTFPANDKERLFMASMDGRRTLSELLQLRTLDVTAALGLVWALYQSRMILFSEVPGDSLSRPVRSAGQFPSLAKEAAEAEPARDPLSVWAQIFGTP